MLFLNTLNIYLHNVTATVTDTDKSGGFLALAQYTQVLTNIRAFFVFGIIFCLVFIISFIWKVKYKKLFEMYGSNMEPTHGIDFYSYKKIIREQTIDYALYVSNPKYLRNNGFLLIRRNEFQKEKISLMIIPCKDQLKYYILRGEINESPRKTPKIEISYANGVVISTDSFIYERKEEIKDLIIHAQSFWQL